MELLVLNLKNATRSRMRMATVRINRIPGTVSFSKAACERMGLTSSSCLSFCQDKKNPRDWYIRIDDPDGFQPRKTGVGQLILNTKKVAVRILDSLGINSTCGFSLGSEPEEFDGVRYWAIITSNRIGEA